MGGRVLAATAVGLAAFAAVGVYGRTATPAQSAPARIMACGSERWAVKTLTDPAAAKVVFTNVKARTVEGMRHLKVPKNLKATSKRRTGAERTVYKVTVLLMSMRREDDSDVHLVVTDPKLGGSMIVEFPSTTCTEGADETERAAMTQARADLSAACGGEVGVTPVTLTGSATISGVGFFDLIHGQAGVAPNGVELHPALSFVSANCKRTTPQHG